VKTDIASNRHGQVDKQLPHWDAGGIHSGVLHENYLQGRVFWQEETKRFPVARQTVTEHSHVQQ
jgi:hypothetical protein